MVIFLQYIKRKVSQLLLYSIVMQNIDCVFGDSIFFDVAMHVWPPLISFKVLYLLVWFVAESFCLDACIAVILKQTKVIFYCKRFSHDRKIDHFDAGIRYFDDTIQKFLRCLTRAHFSEAMLLMRLKKLVALNGSSSYRGSLLFK